MAQRTSCPGGNSTTARHISQKGRVACRSSFGFSSATRACTRNFVVSAALAEMLSYYHGHKTDAEALLAVGESKPDASLDAAQLAAWTNICNGLLNLDETLNK